MANGIIGLMGNIGTQLNELMTTGAILYGVYLIAFFFGVWVIINVALQKVPQFRGKPAKVVATMFSIITVGSIFYDKDTEMLLLLFNSFGGFLLILFLGLAFIAGGIFAYYNWYYKRSESERKINHNVAILFLSLGILIGTSLLIPHFPIKYSDGMNCPFGTTQGNSLYCFGIQNAYLAQLQHPDLMNIFGEIFAIANPIALLAIVVSLIRLVFSLGEHNPTTSNDNISHKSKEEKQRLKEIKNIKDLIQGVNTDLRELNTHFNNKINLLNDLRRQIGNYRMKGGNR